MPVKKFEAKSVKEALAMVKAEFGPDAVILSAKDMGTTYGLAGEKSVQVTAAVSDKTLQQKKYAENSLPGEMLNKFKGASALQQKQYITSLIDNLNTKNDTQTIKKERLPSEPELKIKQMYSRSKKKVEPRKYVKPHRPLTATHYMDIVDDEKKPVTATRYMDIKDDEPIVARPKKRASKPSKKVSNASKKVKPSAPREVESGGMVRAVEPTYKEEVHAKKKSIKNDISNKEVLDLKKQIDQLQSLVKNFQTVPQNFVSLHPGAEAGLPYELSGLYTKLERHGFAQEHITSVLKEATTKLSEKQMKHKALLEAWVAQYIMHNTYLSTKPFSKKYQVFIGGSGQGKTSVLIKSAALLALQKQRRVAIVSLDNQKVGATEQLKIYAQILNIPFTVINSANEWSELYSELESFDHILIDTPSCSSANHGEIIDLKEMLPKVKTNIDIHYVQSLLSRKEDAFDRAQSYLGVGFNDVIFTHTDDSTQYGLVYNFQKRFEVPIHSFSTGSKIPEDFELATREKYVDLIFRLSRQKK